MKKIRCYHCTKEIYDATGQKHTILVYGELVQTNEDQGFVIAPVTYTKKGNDIVSINDKYNIIGFRDNHPTRKFNLGWAICDSNDNFDLATGIKLAKKRFSDSPMTTTDVRFFSDDMIKVVLENETDFIFNHIEKYIPNVNFNPSTEINEPNDDTECLILSMSSAFVIVTVWTSGTTGHLRT